MRKAIIPAILLLLGLSAGAQTPAIDSMRSAINYLKKDTATVKSINRLTRAFLERDDCDSGLHYSRISIKMGNELGYKAGLAEAKYRAGVSLRCTNKFAEAYLILQEGKATALEINNQLLAVKCIRNIGSIFLSQDKTAEALESFFEAVALSERIKDTVELTRNLREVSDIFYRDRRFDKSLEYAQRIDRLTNVPAYLYTRDVITEHLGYIYMSLKNDSLAIKYQLESLKISENRKDTLGIANSYIQLGDFYMSRLKYDSAIHYFIKAEPMYRVISDTGGIANSFYMLANAYTEIGKTDQALKSYQESLRLAQLQDDNYVIADNYLTIGQVYMGKKKFAEALNYLRKYLVLTKEFKFQNRIADAYYNLAGVYEKMGNTKEALHNIREYALVKDSIYKKGQANNLIGLEAKVNFEKIVQENKAQKDKDQVQASIKIYSLMAGLAILLLLALLLYRNNKQKQNAKNKIESAFNELKATQTQLIQSEKMASLGQLTAGIAHEIQNPLNFVKNFSEVNTELIDEMQEVLQSGNSEEAIAISKDIRENQEKINHHGNRADAIVKGMLQHSRTSTGVKEPTDLNALTDEYLRLAYHGLKAKDKSFNAIIKTEFDPSLGIVNVIPQDIGRVILNLFTNAFYAVAEKASQSNGEYVPTVYVKTKKMNGTVEIKVTDNGFGVSAKLMDKIFQPFFSTKPTGQGTGLGLSLSYDIVKAHSGDLRAESKEGEYASFLIELPMS